MIAPTTNRITQGKHGTYNAVDYSAKPDRNIYAPENGRITAYGASGTCGNRLELTSGANRHGFCHLERSLVANGATVTKGQAIGIMGYTGYTIPAGVNGTHLHWVINRNGVYIYPPSLVNETNTGEIMDTDAKVANQYYTLRGNTGTAAERKGWIGRSYEEFNTVAKAEVNGRTQNITNLTNTVAALTKERDAARKTVATLTKEVLAERDKVEALSSSNATLQAELDGAKLAYEELKESHAKHIKELEEVIKIKDNEIVRLNKELANCDGESLTWSEHLVAGIRGLLNALNPLSK